MATKQSTRRRTRNPDALDLRTPPKAHRSTRCKHWYVAMRAAVEKGRRRPAIMDAPAEGGAGEVAVTSAALFHLTLLGPGERKAAVAEFDEQVLTVEWAATLKNYTREFPHWSAEKIRDRATQCVYSSSPQCKLYAWVHRRLVRDSKVHNRDLLDWCRVWGGVALWLFLRLPKDEQWALVRHVQAKQAEQVEVDAEAFDVARRIYETA